MSLPTLAKLVVSSAFTVEHPLKVPVDSRLGPNRGVTFLASLLLHLSVVALLVMVPAEEADRLIFRAESVPIDPASRRIIWYRPVETLPEVAPPEASARSAVLPPEVPAAPQTIASTELHAKPGPQLIWQPPPALQLDRPKLSANLVVLAPGTAPAPPPPPRVAKTAKPFVPRETPRPTQYTPLLDLPPPEMAYSPKLTVAQGSPLGGERQPGSRLIPRPFEPPPVPGDTTRATTVDLGAEPAPVVGAGDAAGVVSIIVAGLTPDPSKLALPEGVLPALVSSGPGAEAAASGVPRGGDSQALQAAGAVVGGGGTPALGPPVVQQPPIVPAPKATPSVEMHWAEPETLAPWQLVPRTSLSLALRPGARVIPPLLEARFSDRPVYSTSFEVPGSARSRGDWILWFAEVQPAAVRIALIRPPVPWRSLHSQAIATMPDVAGGGTVLLAAVIRYNGTVDSVAVLHGSSDSLSRAMAELLLSWQFLPAMRNREPMDVYAVIEISVR